jgi:hypothetical protein
MITPVMIPVVFKQSAKPSTTTNVQEEIDLEILHATAYT